jgi:polyphosphate kinase
MINERLLEKARLHVKRWFAARMPRHMVFHDLEHTLSVTRAAVAIGRSIGLTARQIHLLELAALFHDSGYALAYAGHEEKSAELAEAFLEKNGVAVRDIRTVKSLIMATRMGVSPQGELQRIMRDADSSKAGQIDFQQKSERLRSELGAVRGKKPSVAEWLREDLSYLEGHRFHTSQAETRYGAQKRINLEALHQRARMAAKKKPRIRTKELFFDRDLSWLSFNERVLQEAKDPSNPLLERIKFMAIYSSNLDEFYRVRVASLRSLAKLRKTYRTALEVPPEKLVDQLNRKALKQQQEFGALYRNVLLPALAKSGIRLLRDDDLNKKQRTHLFAHFREHIAPLLSTAAIRTGNAPFIEDRKLYFACRLRTKGRIRLVLLNIPSDELGRFVTLPGAKGKQDMLFLDDVIRLCIKELFTGHTVLGCYAVKLTRDADLHLDEEFAMSVKDKVQKSLRKRRTGVPSRFLYDSAMPKGLLRALRTLLGLTKQDTVAGGRYHNFSDLFTLPVEGHAELREKPWPAISHPALQGADPFNAVAKGDILLHFPYNDFSQFVHLLQQAGKDRRVEHIAITLYRVASGSQVCEALIQALRNGKRVTVFVEVQARFDEDSNLFWGAALEKAGARVLYSYEGLKVHCKLCLIERRERGTLKRFAYLGTGNFNERTSRIYSDLGLLTSHTGITSDVASVFAHLQDRRSRPRTEQLLVAPIDLRTRLEALIDKEIEHAQRGLPAGITIKTNSLEDRALISKLYDASNAGVSIRLIVRGICCLVPGVRNMSANIAAVSIIDRYLEHARCFVFENKGTPLVYLASADWMGRNLDRRVEVAFPILDTQLQRQVGHLLELQWQDTVKARIIDRDQKNVHRKAERGSTPLRSQEATYRFIKQVR